jgi:nucleotide-binding universal stress UspA family protein
MINLCERSYRMSDIYKKILIPLDGSEIASQALPYASELAELAGATLILFRVVPDTEQYQMTTELQIVNIGLEEQQHTVEHANHWLQRMVHDLAAQGVRAEPVVDVGDPAEAIVDYAQENGVDLIVMSTHGRTGLARWAYGSVANKVLGAAKCPVLLVRAKFD